MLIRCSRCGKPVHVARQQGMTECGYCYAELNVKDMQTLCPGDLDWKTALYRAAKSSKKAKKACWWLIRLGDSEAIRDYTQRLKRLRSQWEKLTAEAQAALEGDVSEARLQDLIDQFSLLPENAEARAWEENLTQKLAEERARKKLAAIRDRASHTYTSKGLEECLRELAELEGTPGCSELADELHLKIEKLQQEERERQKRIARRILYRRIRRFAVFAACILALFGYSKLSRQVIQPRKLSKARELAATGSFEAAEEAYLAAGRGGLFPNEAIRLTAYEELKALRSDRAAELEAEGEYERAAELYQSAGDQEGKDRVTLAWAEALEAEGDYSHAIELLKQLPDTEDRVMALYAKWTLRLVSEENYKEAVDAFKQADQQMLASQGVTEASLREAWARQELEAGNVRSAFNAITPVKEDASAAKLYRELQSRLMEEELAVAIAAWQEADDAQKAAALDLIRTLSKDYREIDAQLRLWQMADRAGIDLTELYPEGAVVTGLRIPETIQTGLKNPETILTEKAQIDTYKPLVMLRREHEYSLSLAVTQGEVQHNPTSDNYFTLRMMPELWQSLPAERRAETLADCTVVALVNMTYPYAGKVSGTCVVWDYISMMQANQKKPTKELRYSQLYTCFDAQEEVLLWKPGAQTAFRMNRIVDHSRYSANGLPLGFSGPTVDWTAGNTSMSYVDLGLSGKFDEQWALDRLDELYAGLR